MSEAFTGTVLASPSSFLHRASPCQNILHAILGVRKAMMRSRVGEPSSSSSPSSASLPSPSREKHSSGLESWRSAQANAFSNVGTGK